MPFLVPSLWQIKLALFVSHMSLNAITFKVNLNEKSISCLTFPLKANNVAINFIQIHFDTKQTKTCPQSNLIKTNSKCFNNMRLISWAGIYLFNINYRNARTMCEIRSNLTITILGNVNVIFLPVLKKISQIPVTALATHWKIKNRPLNPNTLNFLFNESKQKTQQNVKPLWIYILHHAKTQSHES